jgi:hypothetical protein
MKDEEQKESFYTATQNVRMLFNQERAAKNSYNRERNQSELNTNNQIDFDDMNEL